MKRYVLLFVSLFFLGLTAYAQNETTPKEDKTTTPQEAFKQKELGVELGLFSGVYGKYNFNEHFSLLGQLGMNYDVAYTVPRGFFFTGMNPAINLSGIWYFFRPKHAANQGIYASFGAFGDLGKYALFSSKDKTQDWGGLWSAGIFLKLGVDIAVYKSIRVKASALINEGAIYRRMPDLGVGLSLPTKTALNARNEFLFDLGVVIPLN